ncbi:DALR anticodon-binding domain-containing protein [Streptomyces sp. SCSIO 30461]|uniref:ArgS-related anticodon-binding protein NrtL n=1 Tax=Streptomyces sp. SCSIO 30461 TaxID=3118085 RepID=UPI0030CCA5ED
MTPADLSRTVLGAVRRAVEEGALGEAVAVPDRVVVERPRPGGRGDYATNAALRLAHEARMPAMRVAELLSERLVRRPGIARVEVTGPGFLNITLDTGADGSLVRTVLEQGGRYGHGDAMAGERCVYRHGPEVRGAVVADGLRRLALAQGAAADAGCVGAADAGWARLGVVTHPVASDAQVDVRPGAAGAGAGELLRRYGADAARWAMLRAAAHDRPRFDAGLLVQGEANPFFRVRYAHSRARALARAAEHLGFAVRHDGIEESVDAPALVGAVGDYPRVLVSAVRHRAPDRLARHLETTADAFLGFQHTVLPRGDEKPSAAHRSRLALAEAAGTVLAGGLTLLGISAPEYV